MSCQNPLQVQSIPIETPLQSTRSRERLCLQVHIALVEEWDPKFKVRSDAQHVHSVPI